VRPPVLENEIWLNSIMSGMPSQVVATGRDWAQWYLREGKKMVAVV